MNEPKRQQPLDQYTAAENSMYQPISPYPEENKIRIIRITQLGYGYEVEVGCQSFAIETTSHLIEKLTAYLHNPNGTERKWLKGELFNK